MIKRKSEQLIETRENMRGGSGEVTIRHHFKQDEMKVRCRLCAQLTLPVGAAIGLHEHANEDEIFIIQQGKGVVIDGGKETQVEAGDCILTGAGAAHAIRNNSQSDLIVTAIIIQY